MDLINIENNKIKLSVHTPDYSINWVKLQDVDFSGIGIENISTEPGKNSIRSIARESYIIENLIARWKTRDELYNFEEEKSKKVEEAKRYGRNLIQNKVLELSTEMGENNTVENMLWILILEDGRQTTLKTYSDAVRTGVINKIQQINNCTNWEQFDAITIP